jgi:Zn-dependent protease with chaperone function
LAIAHCVFLRDSGRRPIALRASRHYASTMASFPALDFSAFVEQKRQERLEGALPTGHDYAYSADQTTRAAFERVKAVEIAVSSSVRMFKQVWKNQLLGNSVKVSDRQFPRIHSLVRECTKTLGIEMPQVYIVNSPVMNAATYGTDTESVIMVHSALVDHYTDQELMMVLGHECGHIHNRHVVYLTALHYLTQVAGVFLRWIVEPASIVLRAWSRRAEITCDRAGMLCAKDAKVSARALTKLVLGSRKLYDEFDLEVFLEQYALSQEGIGRYMEAFASHPWLPKRVLAMREFEKSALYGKHVGALGEGKAMSEVDERVRALLQGDA